MTDTAPTASPPPAAEPTPPAAETKRRCAGDCFCCGTGHSCEPDSPPSVNAAVGRAAGATAAPGAQPAAPVPDTWSTTRRDDDPTYWTELRDRVAREVLYAGEHPWGELATSFRASLLTEATQIVAEHATWRDRYLNCVCGTWRSDDTRTHAEHVLACARLDVGAEEVEHRQVHRPATGDSECVCGQWVGPMTTLDAADPRSFASHQHQAH